MENLDFRGGFGHLNTAHVPSRHGSCPAETRETSMSKLGAAVTATDKTRPDLLAAELTRPACGELHAPRQ